jgi:phenylpropionate dioxygenase-like ring-hydroxylating dioxygenase large terminal subunit
MLDDKTPADPDQAIPNDWDRSGLPAWSLFNPELLEAEKELLFRRHWQLICHVGDIPEPGQFVAAEIVGERALVIRG